MLCYVSAKLSAGVSPRFYRWVTETADYVQRGNEQRNSIHIDREAIFIGCCLHLISVNLSWACQTYKSLFIPGKAPGAIQDLHTP